MCQDPCNMFLWNATLVPHNANFTTRWTAQIHPPLWHLPWFTHSRMWFPLIWKFQSALSCLKLSYHFLPITVIFVFVLVILSDKISSSLRVKTSFFILCSIFIHYSLYWKIPKGKVMFIPITSKVVIGIKT